MFADCILLDYASQKQPLYFMKLYQNKQIGKNVLMI